VRTHDGFYMRFGLGFGGFHDYLVADSGDGFSHAGTVTGMGTASEFALGGTPARGLVIGGGIYGMSVLASDFIAEDEAFDAGLPTEINPSPRNLSLIGPFIDYYPDPRNGMHLQAALGFAGLTGIRRDHVRFRDDDIAIGGGLMFGAGYEWWVADEWSVGVLGRVMGAALFQGDDDGADWIHWVVTVPSVLFSVTYH
jgi:hypothetical protein